MDTAAVERVSLTPAVVRTPAFIASSVFAAAVVVGALGTWASVLGGQASFSGTSTPDGKIVLTVGAVPLVMPIVQSVVQRAWPASVAAVGGLVACATAALDLTFLADHVGVTDDLVSGPVCSSRSV
ncbi:hypothetical protein P9209_25570 [Prescottella defluvii]|nr:hypothetical protein P9209_25570 [Prescottella defluvii]